MPAPLAINIRRLDIMKKRNIVFILSAGFMLASCENKAPTTPVTYFDSTAESIYGKISDFSKEARENFIQRTCRKTRQPMTST